jgi:hypothetical protein
MAATGFTPISLYYTTTASAAPTAGNLVAGELALNNNDGKLFYKDSSGVVQTIATKASAALGTSTTGSGATVLATGPTVTNPALGGSTSGSVTLAVPAVAGSNTATFPAATGTVMVSGNQPAFSVYKSGGNQSISNATYTKIQFNTEVFDTNNCFDSTTNYRFTPTVAGYYQINLNTADGSGFATGYQYAVIYKNGAINARTLVGTSVYGLCATVSSIIYCNGTTDYIEGYYYQSSGTTTQMDNGQTNTFMTGCLVRAA